jgi:hypothetical protein
MLYITLMDKFVFLLETRSNQHLFTTRVAKEVL